MKICLFPLVLMLQACGTQYSDGKRSNTDNELSEKRLDFRQSLYAFSYESECPVYGENAIIPALLLRLESQYMDRKSKLYSRVENTQIVDRDLDIWKQEKARELEPEIDCQFIDRKLTFEEENLLKKQLERKNSDLDEVERLLKILVEEA